MSEESSAPAATAEPTSSTEPTAPTMTEDTLTTETPAINTTAPEDPAPVTTLTDSVTDLEKKIIRQMEYYFGDMNLPRDRFLQESIKEDEGWITFEKMLDFNRLKQLSEDTSVIRTAVQKSNSGLLQISEDGTKLRRNPDNPVPENTAERRQELAERTMYLKGFSLDATLDQLYDFFEPYGRIDNVYMRRDPKKKFKGSVFVTFDTDEDFKKLLELPSIQWQGTELMKKPKLQYCKEKEEERKVRLAAYKKTKEEAKVKREAAEKKKMEDQITKGAILYLCGFSEETRREDIKNLLQDLGDIAWVDFNQGDKEAWIRYNEEGKAKEVLEGINKAMNNEVKLNGNVLTGRVLEGDAEIEQWKKMFKELEDKKYRNYGNRGGYRRGGGRGGRGGGRPGKSVRQQFAQKRGKTDDGGPEVKKVKIELTIGGGD